MESVSLNRRDVRYEPDDRPPLLLTMGLGLQYATIAIASIVITPTVAGTVLMLIPVTIGPLIIQLIQSIHAFQQRK